MKYAIERSNNKPTELNNKPKTLTTNPENEICHKEIKQQTQDYNIKSNSNTNLMPIL